MAFEEYVVNLFPIFLKLESRSVVVVGAGKVGESKIAGLLDTGAHIRVVALRATQAVEEWAQAGRIRLERRGFVAADLEGAFLVVVATSSADLNQFVFCEAERRGVMANVVDVPHQCHFFYPAVVRRGDLQIAISTSGQSPFLAQRIRRQLEQLFPPAYAQWVRELGETRREVLNSTLDGATKRNLLESLASRQALEALRNPSGAASKGGAA